MKKPITEQEWRDALQQAVNALHETGLGDLEIARRVVSITQGELPEDELKKKGESYRAAIWRIRKGEGNLPNVAIGSAILSLVKKK